MELRTCVKESVGGGTFPVVSAIYAALLTLHVLSCGIGRMLPPPAAASCPVTFRLCLRDARQFAPPSQHPHATHHCSALRMEHDRAITELRTAFEQEMRDAQVRWHT